MFTPSRPHRGLALGVAVAALSLLAAGCSTTNQAYEQSHVGAPQSAPPQRVAARDVYTPEPGDPIKQAPVEPVARRQVEPDDPTEPFSRNYGSVRPGAPRAAPGRVRISDASAD